MKDEIKEIDITKDLYLCSPLLNTECTKETCYINNGPCCHTVNKEHSQQYLLDYITNLQEKYDKVLELLADFNMPCEYDEGKIPDNYCEEKCDVGDEIYKKCWDKYIELTLQGKSDE